MAMYASEVYTNTTNLQISVGKPADQRFNPVFTINNDNRLVLQQVQVSDASSPRRGGEGVCGTSYREEGRVWYFISEVVVLHTGGGGGGTSYRGVWYFIPRGGEGMVLHTGVGTSYRRRWGWGTSYREGGEGGEGVVFMPGERLVLYPRSEWG